MSSTLTPALALIKAGKKSAWMAGDFGPVAAQMAKEKKKEKESERVVERLPSKPGVCLLDIAGGTGHFAIPAACAAGVTGVGNATNLLKQARAGAAAEGLKAPLDDGDAEQLPYRDQSIDLVLTIFGAMFAPCPEEIAAELVRVCKPGGAMGHDEPDPVSFVGKTFQLTAKLVPPPGISRPLLGGSEPTVRQRLGCRITDLRLTRQKVHLTSVRPEKMGWGFSANYFGADQDGIFEVDPDGRRLN
jgi:ubiquinone/menaquinone biosynthesis C-methylase UbiE